MQSADQAEADAGLARLGLSWSGLLEPEGEDAAPSLLPLAKVIAALEKIPEPSDRGAVVRQVFGGQGGAVLEDLAREAAGPVDGERERARRQALAGMELTPEAFGAAPLTALATVLRQLESLPSASARAAVATDVFGPAGDRVEWLRRQLAAVRSVLALETVGIEPRLLTAGDARAAFAAVQPAVAAETDGQKRMAVLRGLFGPGGAALYADAAGVHEGIDHAWIFRYEDMFSGK
jgi:hypothetical protein